MSFHDFSATTIDGRDQALSTYKGQVVLVVNTASECGFTPQYAGLEKLWRDYRDRGVVVVGFPSNDFGAQEPGSEAEIQSFCTRNFGVTFPLYSKLTTKGAGQSPIYAFLSKKDGPPQCASCGALLPEDATRATRCECGNIWLGNGVQRYRNPAQPQEV